MATITTVKAKINQLNQASFQILCDALLAREGYPGIVALGTKDGAEKTTPGTPDTYFCLCRGKYVFAEYTTQKDGLIAKIRADIDKCLNEEYTGIPLSEITEIVYCHTSSNISPADDRKMKSLCEEQGIKLTLWGIDLLVEKLMNYPSIIKDHLHLTVDSEQIQTIDDFVKQYNAAAIAATLRTEFLFREKEIEALNKAFDKANAVLLVGSAGTGKTRLALEYSKIHADSHNERLLCIHDRSLPMYEDLKLYFEKPGDYFVFIDDANQLSELEHVVEYVNKIESGYNVRILMTVRDYAIDKVKQDIAGITRYDVIAIGSFTDEEISSLMKKHYNIQNQFYLKRIIQIAAGNARIAMLAGKIACDANRLDAINDVSDLYENYYGKVLRESGIEADDQLLISAGIMAFLNAIHLDYIDSIMPVLEEKGLSKTDFEKNIHILHDHEIVDIYYDKGVRFSEQCMANFVLKYVFYDKKVIKLSAMIEVCFNTQRERTVYAVNTLWDVFGNNQIYEYVKAEILELWEKLERENSPVFFEFLKKFYPVNELQTLLMLQKHIDAESPVIMKAEDINTKEGKNSQNISDDIITILGGFSYLENFDAALDLFFQYYLKRPDLYMQFYHASTTCFSIDIHSAGYGYNAQIKFFTKIYEYADNGDDPFITMLFLDIASHFLKLEFTPIESNRDRKKVTLYNIQLSLTAGVAEYRKIIWDFLLKLSSKEQFISMMKDILRAYGEGVQDDSKEVIVFDAAYICKLSARILSPACLADCLIAKSLHDTFEKAEYYTDEMQPYLNSSKYELYKLVADPEWNSDMSYDECRREKIENIREYITSATNKQTAFRDILQLLIDSDAIEGFNSFKISDGVNITLQILADSKDDYISCVEMLLSSETISNINVLNIVKTMFSLLSPAKVYDFLANSHEKQRNYWMFAYYHEIPQEYIDEKVVDGLYSFLADESDRNIQSSPYRDIGFLDKYLTIDNDAVLKASRLILKKKEYSPFMVTIYFELQFNEYQNEPKDVTQRFIRDIKLLEQIYLCLAENGQLTDCRGVFLHEIFMADKTFVKEYIKWFVVEEEKHVSEDYSFLADVFFQEENYLDILDFIVDESIESVTFPFRTVPRIIKMLISSGKKEYSEKSEYWIQYLIKNAYTDKKKMRYLFEALTELSIECAYSYIPLLIDCTDDYGIFEAIPLTPSSYSWSGSCVPMYSSWVEHLEKLLPIFSGLKYISHKNRVQQMIEYYRNEIKKEEILDALQG